MPRPPQRRLVALLGLMLFAFGGIVGRLVYLQVQDSSTFSALGAEQRMRTEELSAIRGRIVDREGVPLAMSLDARDVYVNPTFVVDPFAEAALIAPILEMEEADVVAALTGEGTFAYVARGVDRTAADELASLQLPGLGFLPIHKRYYPAGSLASQVVGFVGVDGEGLTGLERQYDSLLAGEPGTKTMEVSAQGQEIAGGIEVLESPRPGGDLILTIDRQLQFQAQQYLRMAVQDNGAKGGTIIVMDPVRGDVYAMASYPSFDPNRFNEYPSTVWPNRAVTDTWEPGSVNKVITAAAAIETGAVSLKERLSVPATRSIDGYTIHDSHPHPVASMTIGDIIADSSNVGASLLADRVGNEWMSRYFERFGFGSPTGVGFPGEAAGLMPPDDDWTDITRATVSFGAGVAVTPLQMASVYATIANGGIRVQPRLVLGTRQADGATREADPSDSERVLARSTARVLTQMLAFVVEDGTGANARIPGYQVAGKTGTAKKLDRAGNYTNRYVASFVGFLPASRPRVVVAAILDEPDTIYGGVAAAPLFQHVARYAIQRLAIQPAPPVSLPPHVREP